MSFPGFNEYIDNWLSGISIISIIVVPYIFIISLVYLVHKNIKKHIKKTEDIKENIENDK